MRLRVLKAEPRTSDSLRECSSNSGSMSLRRLDMHRAPTLETTIRPHSDATRGGYGMGSEASRQDRAQAGANTPTLHLSTFTSRARFDDYVVHGNYLGNSLLPNNGTLNTAQNVVGAGAGILLIAAGAGPLLAELLPAGVLGTGAATGAAALPAIVTPYANEVQSELPEAQAALAQAQGGATLFRVGELGTSMTGASQYWSLQNPLATAGYANGIGLPNVTSNFVMGGTLAPGAQVVTNMAPGIGANGSGALQVVVSPGGVQGLWFHMP